MHRIQGVGISAALLGALALSGCGSSGPVAPKSPEPVAYAPLSCYGTPGVRACAREDYREAIERDGGKLYHWGIAGVPDILIAPRQDISDREMAVVMRSVGIINRSLPPDQKLRVYHVSGRISGEEFDSGAWRDYLSDGSIWAGFAEKPILGDCGGDKAAGCATLHAPGTRFARTVTKGVAHVYPVVVDSAESQVDVMVHEIMHALGIDGHPHDIHTSIMSYEHDDSGILDNLPLIDAAILYDLNGWGFWSRRTNWTWNTTISNIEFGVRAYDNLHAIPYVDAGSMAPPDPRDLYGSAQYGGEFRGLRNASTRVTANVDISLYFQSDSGSITFSDWQERLPSTSWQFTEAPDIRYGLALGEHWFASLGPDGDWDGNGAPDVQGALYSHWNYSEPTHPDAAAGTLERGTLVGGFGGERDDEY